MANPIQQGLKRRERLGGPAHVHQAAMANPIQQGLKRFVSLALGAGQLAAMANPIQQGLKLGRWFVDRYPPASRNG